MFSDKKFSITNSEHFTPSRFPQLDTSLQEIVEQLAKEEAGSKTEMIISFVKDHCINSQQVKENPRLASRISFGTLPLQIMEDLFKASKGNSAYRNELEGHIRNYLQKKTV